MWGATVRWKTREGSQLPEFVRKASLQMNRGTPRRLGTLAIALVVVVFAVLLPAEVAETSTGTDAVFVITGIGQKVLLRAEVPGAGRGKPDCAPGKTAEVLVAIGGGRTGNSVTGEAVCGGTVVASATAYDLGADFARGTQVVGGAECHFIITGSPPPSEWTVKCHFYSN